MNRMPKCILTVLLFAYGFTAMNSQVTDKTFARSVQQADISFYYDEDYLTAAKLYEPLYKAYPDNNNLAAKLGICYLNITGKKKEALELLKKASVNIVTDEKEYIENGEKASLDTYMYLAIAYHVNDSLEQAIDQYNVAKEKLTDSEVFREEYIDKQIGSCRYSMEMKKKPVRVLSDLFTPWLKDYPGACNPVISKNDSVFVFTQKTDGKTSILCSLKGQEWEKPSDITEQLGGYDRFYSKSLTGDGKLLILYMDDGGDGNLYFSERNDTTWTKIKNLGKPINTIYWEASGFITPDGNSMFISSNRPGGYGELDLWLSEKQADDSWGEPVNLGERINTPYNEDTPFFDPDNDALIFSSEGHVTMGNYDVFRSVVRSGNWTNPVAMPYAFNTTGDNTSFILNNNAPGFIAGLYNEEEEALNIYGIVGVDPADELTTAEGSVILSDGLKADPDKAQLKLTDAAEGTLIETIPLNRDGTFKFEFKPGEYKLITSHEGYKPDTVQLSLPLYFLSQYMAVNPNLIPLEVAAGGFLSITNILFEFDRYDLTIEAKSALEEVRSILVTYPDLEIEVAGYTDAKGSSAYNLRLADRRAQAVIDYLTSSAIPASRFVKKSFGESNFAAINNNPDGSDNPEGRKYNRRVTFGIVDPQSGIILRQDTYTPEHLRMASANKYSIILMQTDQKLSSGYFSNLDLHGRLFLRTIEAEPVFVYTVGVFYNNSDATRFLSYVREKGFKDAYIINHYELGNISVEAVKLKLSGLTAPSGSGIYTIQIKASLSPLNMNLFNDIRDVREVYGEDGYYRYLAGEYQSIADARKELQSIQKAGFGEAFVRELNLLLNE